MLPQKLQSNVMLARHEKFFVEQIPIKFGSFYGIKMKLLQIVLSSRTPKYQ